MNQPDNYFWCPGCGCVYTRPAGQGYPSPCSNAVCRAANPRPQWQPFDCDTWAECQTHRVHASVLRHARVTPSERKLRLRRCAFARFAFPAAGQFTLFARAVDCGDEWAETGTPPDDMDVVRGRAAVFARRAPRVEDNWGHAATMCLGPQRDLDPGKHYRAHWKALADSYREFFPNPFVPLTWNPVWFTSTVRDLAAHIYASREFGAMPILADALQDAGCADEQVLTHCCANKPHARGCWVLDAILGKS